MSLLREGIRTTQECLCSNLTVAYLTRAFLSVLRTIYSTVVSKLRVDLLLCRPDRNVTRTGSMTGLLESGRVTRDEPGPYNRLRLGKDYFDYGWVPLVRSV